VARAAFDTAVALWPQAAGSHRISREGVRLGRCVQKRLECEGQPSRPAGIEVLHCFLKTEGKRPALHGHMLNAKRLLTGWSLVRIRPGEPNTSKA
jgi:hypothetical protein